jgi:hypothetical protein
MRFGIVSDEMGRFFVGRDGRSEGHPRWGAESDVLPDLSMLEQWRQGSHLEGVWLDGDPGTHHQWLPLLVQLDLPIVVSAPLATSAQELKIIERTFAGSRLSVAHDLPLRHGLHRAVALCGERRLGKVRALALDVQAAVPVELKRAMQDVRFHDALLQLCSGVFALFRRLGLPVAKASVVNEVALDYWYHLDIRCDLSDGVGATVTITPAPGVPEKADESLRVDGEVGVLVWRLSPQGERLQITQGADARVVDLDAGGRREAAWVAHAAAVGDAGASPTLPSLPEERHDCELAIECVDKYLYGNAKALQKLATEEMIKSVARQGSAFKDFGHIRIGHRFATLLADGKAAQPFMEPLDSAFRLCLIRVPSLNKWRLDCTFPPLALGQLSAFVAPYNVESHLIDLLPDVAPPSPEDTRRVAEMQRKYRIELPRLISLTKERLADRQFDLVGFSVEDPEALFVVEGLIREVVRDHSKATLIGGRGVSSLDRKRLSEEKLVDYVIQGEGELPLLGLIKSLRGLLPFSNVPGLWRTSEDSWNPQTMHDLALYPVPDFGCLDMNLYESGKFTIPTPFLPYLFILGCPYRCAFCSNDAGQKARLRPLELVVDDLRQLREKYDTPYFYFLNNMINTNPRYMRAFVQAMRQADLDTKWCDCARPAMITPDQIGDLASIGCVELTWGVDTGSQRLARMLDMAGKVQTATEVIKTAHGHGIANTINLIVGMPQETEEDFEETVRFAELMRPYAGFSLNHYNYNSGSPVYETPADFGLRRRGETFSEISGASWDEHRENVERRVRILRKICPREPPRVRGDGRGSTGMAGAEFCG